MENDWNKWLHERAYALWEDDGRPDGKNTEHWSRAEQEIKQNSAPAGDVSKDDIPGTDIRDGDGMVAN
ncbi:hypothetical protein QO002_004465 [Pararhizobium capsulatum DSM 1112]|uniref:DUF2934 domain-containing protein n=1 Tax=Pararhizobium capsulatum DSM 1112 TaxID=1121113 RepID=A0ABU0BVJ4_9HYPH|nr:DUF2934 domain-containing protein [Pararhizobium capsulatum]MDQ0322259.1 hypothetical protein [Pararhizobium capsulatum DSM 1112]